MGENERPTTVYIEGQKITFTEIPELSIENPEAAEDFEEAVKKIQTEAVTIGTVLLGKAWDELTKSIERAAVEVAVVWEALLMLCAPTRVAHLMRRGKRRTRKKNRNRAVKCFKKVMKIVENERGGIK